MWTASHEWCLSTSKTKDWSWLYLLLYILSTDAVKSTYTSWLSLRPFFISLSKLNNLVAGCLRSHTHLFTTLNVSQDDHILSGGPSGPPPDHHSRHHQRRPNPNHNRPIPPHRLRSTPLTHHPRAPQHHLPHLNHSIADPPRPRQHDRKRINPSAGLQRSMADFTRRTRLHRGP